jgi:DNA-binding CsgD family transcriptional regulator
MFSRTRQVTAAVPHKAPGSAAPNRLDSDDPEAFSGLRDEHQGIYHPSIRTSAGVEHLGGKSPGGLRQLSLSLTGEIQMIQVVPSASRFGFPGELDAAAGLLPQEDPAYRGWLSRRDSARQQIRRLSRRELQVVQLVSNGHANKSIAMELRISVKTIEKHRANAARKLGVNSTAEMVRLAVLADHEATSQNSAEQRASENSFASRGFESRLGETRGMELRSN